MEKTKILVVDDDDSIRTTMAAILEDEGYIVDLAKTGQEAIEKTNNNTYNLALLDIRLQIGRAANGVQGKQYYIKKVS
jgi:CheY-like chemotaxis protein